jgi:hypothetical protein
VSSALRSGYIRVLPFLLGAAIAGFVVRLAGLAEGIMPSSGLLPIVVSGTLCATLWIALWDATPSLSLVSRRLCTACVPFVMGATASVVWAAYAVMPGTALAFMFIALRPLFARTSGRRA